MPTPQTQAAVAAVRVCASLDAMLKHDALRCAPASEALHTAVLRHAKPSSTVESAHRNSAGFKLVLKLPSSKRVEAVAIVHEAGGATNGRVTVCVSSQVGCAMGCTFCATGQMGFKGNLSAGEILEQVWHVEQQCSAMGVHWPVTNVVFMGMGEPLNNYGAMLEAVRGLRTLWAMPASRITVSTVGVVNRIRSLAADAPGVNLALSLHAPTQELRLRLVPSSRSYTLPKLMAAVDDYCRASAQQVMVEYILIDGVNASDDEARELGALLCGRDVQCNLIPYNSTAAGDVHGYRSPTDEQTQQFAAAVTALARVAVTVRWSTMHGREADAACGQLALRSQAGPPPRHDEGSCDVGEIEDLSLGGETAASAGTRAGVVGTVHGIDSDAAAEATALAGAVVEAEAQLGELERALLADGVPAEWVPLYARRVFDSDRVEVPRGGSAGAAAAGEGLAAPESVHAAAYGRRLREALSAALGGALESLHLLEQDTPTPPMQHALKCAGRAANAAWASSPVRHHFLAAYRDYVRHVVLPRVDRTRSGRCVCQAEPTIRVALPGGRAAGGRPRCDAEYFHQAAELTFHMPCTDGATMLVASHPAVGDASAAAGISPASELAPLRVTLGQCASFWGHRLAHGSTHNGGEQCLVSIDFRVIPWPLFAIDREHARSSSHNLTLGGYYSVVEAATAADSTSSTT